MLKNECLEYKKIIKFTDKELGDFLDFISNKSVGFVLKKQPLHFTNHEVGNI